MPEKLTAIESFLVRLRAIPDDRSALAGLATAVHRLAGSAGTHGLASVSKTATEWETFLRRAEAKLGPDDLAPMERWLEEIRGHLRSDAALAGTTPGPEPAPGLPALVVLVVDDVPSNVQVIRLMLDRLGQKADGVSSGTDAVGAVERREYDLVLMDLQMPEMDGLEAARRIRRLAAVSHQPRLVAMTAGDDPADLERCRAAGMDGRLTKPVTFEDLRRELAASRLRH